MRAKDWDQTLLFLHVDSKNPFNCVLNSSDHESLSMFVRIVVLCECSRREKTVVVGKWIRGRSRSSSGQGLKTVGRTRSQGKGS